MSTVINFTPDDVKVSDKFHYALIDGVHARIADNLWLNSKEHLIMHGTKGIELSDLRALLVDEDRCMFDCGCCVEFFHKYSNLLVIKPDGKIESALFRNASTSNVHARAFFNKLADIVEAGKPSHFIGVKLRGFQPNVKIRVGVKCANEKPHYHGFIYRQNLPRHASFKDTVNYFTNLQRTYKCIDLLADAMEAINPIFMHELGVPIKQRKIFNSSTRLITSFRNSRDSTVSHEHAVAMMWRTNIQDIPTLKLITHSSLNCLINNFLRNGDYKKSLSVYLDHVQTSEL